MGEGPALRPGLGVVVTTEECQPQWKSVTGSSKSPTSAQCQRAPGFRNRDSERAWNGEDAEVKRQELAAGCWGQLTARSRVS